MKITTIARYISVRDLAEDYFPDELDQMGEEEIIALGALNDYEYFGYTVINDSEVVIDDDGEVIGQQPLAEFWTCTMDYIRQ